jgi:hypothetical protein
MFWLIIACLAGLAACPIMFAGMWTKKGFRVAVYIATFLLVTLLWGRISLQMQQKGGIICLMTPSYCTPLGQGDRPT